MLLTNQRRVRAHERTQMLPLRMQLGSAPSPRPSPADDDDGFFCLSVPPSDNELSSSGDEEDDPEDDPEEKQTAPPGPPELTFTVTTQRTPTTLRLRADTPYHRLVGIVRSLQRAVVSERGFRGGAGFLVLLARIPCIAGDASKQPEQGKGEAGGKGNGEEIGTAIYGVESWDRWVGEVMDNCRGGMKGGEGGLGQGEKQGGGTGGGGEGMGYCPCGCGRLRGAEVVRLELVVG